MKGRSLLPAAEPSLRRPTSAGPRPATPRFDLGRDAGVKAGVAIEQLAEDIARRTLLQSLTVRAVCDADGVETGMYEVPSGGRRFRALELLVKQRRLSSGCVSSAAMRLR